MNAIELLKADHRTVEGLFDQYENAPSPAEKTETVKGIVRELSVHAALEEQFVYPLIRYTLENGGDKADHAIDEHAEVKRLLADIEKLDTTDESFYEKVRTVIANVKEHVGEEEGQLFPQLQEKVGADKLDALGQLMDKAKGLLPTHPHPIVPGTATAQLLAGPWASIADHIRDFVDGLRKPS